MAGPRRTTIDDIELDVLLSLRRTARVELTKHPIEEGADPTDHARELPEAFTLEGFVTNAPLAETDRTARGEYSPRASGYADQVKAKLRALKSSRRAITVTTPKDTFENVVMTELSIADTAQLGDALQFTATFEQVRFVSNETVRLQQQVKPTTIPKKPTGKVDQGKKQPTAAPEHRSWAKGLTDSLGFTKPGSGL